MDVIPPLPRLPTGLLRLPRFEQLGLATPSQPYHWPTFRGNQIVGHVVGIPVIDRVSEAALASVAPRGFDRHMFK